jgi:hypothetical protein
LHDIDIDIDEDLDLDRQDDKACRPTAPKPQKCGARTLSRHEKDFVQSELKWKLLALGKTHRTKSY